MKGSAPAPYLQTLRVVFVSVCVLLLRHQAVGFPKMAPGPEVDTGGGNGQAGQQDQHCNFQSPKRPGPNGSDDTRAVLDHDMSPTEAIGNAIPYCLFPTPCSCVSGFDSAFRRLRYWAARVFSPRLSKNSAKVLSAG